jgi:transposase-like protein
MEAMLEAEMTEHLGYERYEAKGRNGHSKKKLESSAGADVEIRVPRDRKSEFEPHIIRKYETSSSELED